MPRARVEVIAGDPARVVEIPPGGLEIGRAVADGLTASAPSLSKRHARIYWEGDDLLVVDLGSRNGVVRDGVRLTGATLLAEGDELVLGELVLRVDLDEPGYGLPLAHLGETSVMQAVDPDAAIAETEVGRRAAAILPVVESFFHVRDARELGRKVVQAIRQVLTVSRAALIEIDPSGARFRVLGLDGADDPAVLSRTLIAEAVKRGVSLHQTGAMGRVSSGSLVGAQATSALAVAVRSQPLRVAYVDVITSDHLRVPQLGWQQAFELQLIGASAAGAFDALATHARAASERLRFEGLRRHFSPSTVEQLQLLGREHELLAPRILEATVLFADLAGFAELAARWQDEPASIVALLDRWLETATQIVFAHGGTLDKYVGDTVMAVFGAPFPLTDAPLAAARCALALEQAAAGLSALFPLPLAATVALDTGMLLSCATGPRRHHELTVLGDIVGTASLLRDAAPPGSIVVGERTAGLLAAAAHLEPAGELPVAGGRSVPVWRLLGMQQA